jgi:hypothetical protein
MSAKQASLLESGQGSGYVRSSGTHLGGELGMRDDQFLSSSSKTGNTTPDSFTELRLAQVFVLFRERGDELPHLHQSRECELRFAANELPQSSTRYDEKLRVFADDQVRTVRSASDH